MKTIGMLTALLVALAAGPAAAQERDRGGLGGVLDTLGGLLGGSLDQAHGTVVLAHDRSVVFRTDDGRTVRVDTGALDADTRARLRPGQSATLSARGAGDILTATDARLDQDARGRTFQAVHGTVQERKEDQLLFRTRDGLVLPVETSRIRGLPSFRTGDPATLIYEQGPNQALVGVWVEPGDAAAAGALSGGAYGTRAPYGSATPGAPPAGTPWPPPSASPGTQPSASLPGSQTVEGMVETLGRSDLTLTLPDGRRMAVDASRLAPGALDALRPGDRVEVTGTLGADRFVAASVNRVR